MEMESAWDFVGRYYPNYHSCDEIARNGDLQKLLDGEIDGCAEEMLHRDYAGDEKNPQIQIDYNASIADIYERAIEGYIAELNDQKPAVELLPIEIEKNMIPIFTKKHKGKTIGEIMQEDAQYLVWALENIVKPIPFKVSEQLEKQIRDAAEIQKDRSK